MPAKKTIRPFGTWASPLDAASVARGARRFGRLQADGGWLYWTEGRPEERGRQTLMRARPGSEPEEILRQPFSARSRVHEYGGGEFLAAGDDIYFVNDADQDVYCLRVGENPRRLTRSTNTRFADFALDAKRQRLIAVAERHAKRSAHPQNLLVSIALAGRARGQISELATGHDFYSDPRLSPDGDRLAFVVWDLPDMPWDQSVLYLAGVTKSGALRKAKAVAGGGGDAAAQPEWSSDGTLYFVLDGRAAQGLHRIAPGGRIAAVETGIAGELSRPQWVFGTRSYALSANGSFAVSQIDRGASKFAVIATSRRRKQTQATHKLPFRALDQPTTFGDTFAGMAVRDAASPAIAVLDGARPQIVRSTSDLRLAAAMISKGRVMTFRGDDGRDVYGVFYAPANPGCQGPKDARPPLIVLVHGGPTSMTERGFKPRVQFFTTRGFAVLDLDYSGSTGYGRAYRERLDGRWGEIDVADAALAAQQLAKRYHVDATRMAIAGGSAGGYTVLMALATTSVFAAGSSHYGISDLGLLLAHTHKFESGYLHRLMGTTPDSWKPTFEARSPIRIASRITSPVILFQGLDDKVVSPEQSRRIVAELKRRKIEVAYHEFAGEGHGFRRAETIIAVLETELAFLRRNMRLA
jgi:dipeptidyl aminopeptidase/acylaminoacyl peptidase